MRRPKARRRIRSGLLAKPNLRLLSRQRRHLRSSKLIRRQTLALMALSLSGVVAMAAPRLLTEVDPHQSLIAYLTDPPAPIAVAETAETPIAIMAAATPQSDPVPAPAVPIAVAATGLLTAAGSEAAAAEAETATVSELPVSASEPATAGAPLETAALPTPATVTETAAPAPGPQPEATTATAAPATEAAPTYPPETAPETTAEREKIALAVPESAAPTLKTAAVAAAPDPVCRGQIEQLAKGAVVAFDTGSAVIRQEQAQTIRSLFEASSKCPGVRLEVAGHTDRTGADAQNFNLSWERAEAVIGEARAMGFDTAATIPVGYGSRKPKANLPAAPKPEPGFLFFEPGISDEDMQRYRERLTTANSKNRRVEFILR